MLAPRDRAILCPYVSIPKCIKCSLKYTVLLSDFNQFVTKWQNIDISRYFFMLCKLHWQREHIWGCSIRIWKGLTSYFYLTKPIKWSLKYIKGLSSIKAVTNDDFKVILWAASDWKILKRHLRDHLISFFSENTRSELSFAGSDVFSYDFISSIWLGEKKRIFLNPCVWSSDLAKKKLKPPIFAYIKETYKWSFKFRLSIFNLKLPIKWL